MKKFVAGLAVVLGMSVGAVGVAGAADAGYPGTPIVGTHAGAPGHIHRHHRATVKVTIVTGGAHRRGHVVFLVRRANGHLVSRNSKAIRKHQLFKTPKLTRGNFFLVIKVVNAKGVIYKGSYERHKLHVA